MSDIQIYIFTYSRKVHPPLSGWIKTRCSYIPLEVGVQHRDVRNEVRYSIRDDMGQHISAENPHYGELTGMYWIWKNTSQQFVGFYHYNKHLRITNHDLDKLVSNNVDFLVEKRVRCISHSIQDEYRVFEKVIQKYDNHFFEVYKSIFDDSGSGLCSMQNMFITKRELFDEYCSFIFPLLKSVRESIGEGVNDPYHKRYCAFFAERLLTPFLVYRGYSYEEVDIDWHPGIKKKVIAAMLNAIGLIIPGRIKVWLMGYLYTSSYRNA